MTVDDPYHELGLAPDCSDAELKAAWRRLAAQWHPDRNPSPQALRKIQRINRAIEQIRRARGDQAPEVQADVDIEQDIELTLDEVLTGCAREVRGQIDEDCADCEGSGLQLQPSPCSACDGAGQVRQPLWFGWVATSVECSACQGQGSTRQGCPSCAASGKAPARAYRCRVKIAPGARAGDTIDATARVQGRQGKHTIALRLRVQLQPHALFRAQADGTVHCELPVDGFAWMANRWTEVPTPRGMQQMRLRREHLGYRIKGAGLPWGSNGQAGDCIVTVAPLFPDELDAQQEAALDALVSANTGAADTPAGLRMARWRRELAHWRAGRA